MYATSNLRTARAMLTVISDTICPWCYIGKRRLEVALRELRAEGLAFDVEWRPYQLNPGMPEGGLDRGEYRAAKFGAARSDALDRQMVDTGAEIGISFRYDLIERTPSTLASHVLIADARLAGGLAMQDRAVEALFSAYFTEGRDVGSSEVLREIAQELGFDHAESVGAELWELVEQEDTRAREAGVSGVPTFLLNGRLLFTCAQSSEVIVAALRDANAALEGLDARNMENRR
jgi:predicted DsbA family dithiol-disulfide isomerase